MHERNAILLAAAALLAGCASTPPSPGDLGVEPLAQITVFFDA